MPSSSCSFRISRTAEDLAQTINALSQRLVKLEERQEAFELSFRENQQEPSPDEIQMLDGAEKLLKECQELLISSDKNAEPSEMWADQQENLAA